MSDSTILNQILNGNGLLSTKNRYERGIFIKGESSAADIGSGGGSSVFCRVERKGVPTRAGLFPQIIIDRSQLGRLDWYAHQRDSFGFTGTKPPPGREVWKTHKERITAREVGTRKMTDHGGNEVMFEHGVPVSAMRAVVVHNDQRSFVLNTLRESGITKVNGIPIEKFIVEEYVP